MPPLAGDSPRSCILVGAQVVDGTGTDPYVADVLVDRGKVIAIGAQARSSVGHDTQVVDAAGLVLAPGFVDLHSHSDLYTLLREEPGSPPSGDSPKLAQGCTAQVFGQDGISAAPVSDEDLDDHLAFLAGLDGRLPDEMWTWRTFAEYLSAVRTSAATRTAVLAGHSTIR